MATVQTAAASERRDHRRRRRVGELQSMATFASGVVICVQLPRYAPAVTRNLAVNRPYS